MKFTRRDNGLSIAITKIPERKKPVLLIGTENEYVAQYNLIATFKSDEDADEFEKFLTMFTRDVR